MDNLWITLLFLVTILFYHETRGQSDINVELKVAKFVQKGSSVKLHCVHNVQEKDLYKVTWLKNAGDKLFEYIKGRKPPYRNFSIPGAEIDWLESRKNVLQLKELHFDASGIYYCEVSTDTPIFTKASDERRVDVYLPQTQPPKITFKKRQFFYGDKLIANCTTSKAHPPPHITWLINGEQANLTYVQVLHPQATAHRPKSHNRIDNPIQQLRSMMPNRGDPYDMLPHESYTDRYDNNFAVDQYGRREHFQHFDDNNEYNPLTVIRRLSSSNHEHKIAHHARKHRRYVNEGGGGGIGGGGTFGSTSHHTSHKATISSSQLTIPVAYLEPGASGRLELTCLATIPAYIAPGDSYADYKTYSAKIDIDKPDQTTLQPPISGPAASTGNGSPGKSATAPSASTSRANDITLACLPTLLLLFYRFVFSYTIG